MPLMYQLKDEKLSKHHNLASQHQNHLDRSAKRKQVKDSKRTHIEEDD